ncbi:TonB-dependent receptor family protein [Tahibacter amnicola]|uniref:TonB-dependent receptor n=1 Tax=Tahibacter amnicola TaxID=2976241 RepID=A0ABY6BGT1_9GAMM|nr:TonB-dependent receptor [Tahibacter amnicola]UXI68722.1 TonB-dependent receptor [Tahibacter amnicola]
MRRLVAPALALAAAAAQAADPPPWLPPILVSPTPDALVSAGTVHPAREAALGVGLSDYLAAIPGVLGRHRQNYAQDEQVAIRGFGARAPFGIRGVRLYVDGIPATLPDGQGQASHIIVDAAARIDVLKGPFSALFGNASGGVIAVTSRDGRTDPGLQARMALASHGTRRQTIGLGGGADALDYRLELAHTEIGGERPHSRARRETANLVSRVQLAPETQITLAANHFDQPFAQDPLGLSASQWRDRVAVTPGAIAFNTRKTVQQDQLGLTLDHAGTWHTLVYAGNRQVRQFLAVPVAAQANPLSGGGVVDLDTDYRGADLRWTFSPLGRLEGVLGFSLDQQRQHRRGYENSVGDRLGVVGRLRRDQTDRVTNADPYAQLRWRVADSTDVLAGMRRSRVRFRSADRHITPDNPDDSGRTDYAAWLPVAGVRYRPTPRDEGFVSYGRGLETPTSSELAYRRDGSAGLASDLRAARSRSVEAGWQHDWPERAALALALFRADSRNELAVASNLAGRTSYRNIGHSRREGLEVSARDSGDGPWRWQLAATAIDARYRTPFPACTTPGCTEPTVPAGTRIPAIPRTQAQARLGWADTGGWRWDAEARWIGAVTADDLGQARTAGHLLLGVSASRTFSWSDGALRIRARIDNLFDRRHIGSVIVNESNGRFYEPGPGRSGFIEIEYRHSQRFVTDAR